MTDHTVNLQPGHVKSIRRGKKPKSGWVNDGILYLEDADSAKVPALVIVPPPATGDLQALINAAPSGGTVNYSGTHTGSVTVNKSLTIVGGQVNGKVTITANDVTLRQMVVLGPQFANYVGGQDAIYAANVSNVTLDRVEAGNAGDSGVRLHYVTGFTILTPNIHDTVYAGIITTSSTDGLIAGGTVQRVGMNGSSAANSDNAYGIALTRYLNTEPQAVRITVRNVTVNDVPTWHGLDTHGGLDILFENNTVARTYRGIMVTASNGQRVTVRGNNISAASYMGIAVVDTRPYVVTGNTISGPTYGIFVDTNACGTISGNTITGSGTPILDRGTRC